jgi:integrase/recombinase XerC
LRVRGCPAGTLKTARSVLLRVERHAGRPLVELDHSALYAWQVDQAARVLPDSLRTQLGYLVGFYRWAGKHGRITTDPTLRLDLPKKPYRLPRPIAEDRLRRALEAADDEMRVILVLAAFCGLRAVEVARLVWDDVDLDGRTLRVIGKGNRERVLPIAPVVAEALARLPHRVGPVLPRHDGEPGHNDPNRISARANNHLRALGIRDTYHSLRHAFGTAVYRASKDIRATQRAMGHVSVANTERYVLLVDDEMCAAVLGAAGAWAS